MGSCCCNFCNFILISDVHWVSNLSFNITCPSQDTRSRLVNFWRTSFSLSKKVKGFSLDHRKSKRVPEKTSTSALLTMPKPLTVNHRNCGKFFKNGNTRPPDLSPEESVCRSRNNSKNWTWNRMVPNQERSTLRLYFVTLLI